jgi:DNA-binding XRE family transcriptional regulator
MDDRMSDMIRGRAQRTQSLLMRSMAAVTQRRVADMLGVSESALSAMKADHLERFAGLVVACGLKLVPATDQTFDESYISALKTLAAVGLGRPMCQTDEGDE